MSTQRRGGYKLVEFSSDPNLSTVQEITNLLKDGTSIVPNTPVETLADGNEAPAGKGLKISIRSSNIDQTVFDALRAFELAQTKLTFRYLSLEAPQIICDCEAAWSEYVQANVTSTLDNAVFKVGAGSAKLDVAANAGTGRLATKAVTSIDLSTRKELSFWIKSSIDLAAGDLQLLLDDTAACASPLETLNIPAIANGVWTKVNLAPVTPANLTAVISIGLNMAVDKGAFIVNIDDIRAVVSNFVVKGVIPMVDQDAQQSGKFNATKVTGNGFAYRESDVIVFTP
jgi:hypothetical protein